MVKMADVSKGDSVIVNWEDIRGVPATVRNVYRAGVISVSIQQKDLEHYKVQRDRTMLLAPDNTVHLVLIPGEYEVFGKSIITH